MRPFQATVVLACAVLAQTLAPTSRAAEIRTSDRIAVLQNQHGYYPCMDCHADQVTNPTPRFLTDEHDVPLEWQDEAGTTHFVPFGERVSFAQLLGRTSETDLRARNLARIGQRLGAETYMEENGYTLDDSVYALTHGGANLWCLDCHDADDRNQLRKLDGELLSYNQSQYLCGQCHGPILKDWEFGAHGRTNGYWNVQMDTDSVTTRLLCVECHIPHAPHFASRMPKPGPVSRLDNISHPDPHKQHESNPGKRDDLGPHPWEKKAQPATDKTDKEEHP